MYLRDRKNNPVGCLAIHLNAARQQVEYQLSVAAPEDKFDKAMGRQLAIGRLVEKPFVVNVRADAVMHDAIVAVMANIAACRSDTRVMPCRAIKVARGWLKAGDA